MAESKKKKAQKEREKQFTEIVKKANELGMSYGKYVAMLEMEKARKERELRRESVSAM